MHKTIISSIFLLLILYGCADKVSITVVPRSDDTMLQLKILEPKNGEIIDSDSIKIVFETENFNIGDNDYLLHVILDNGPRLIKHTNEPLYISSLAEGRHIIRAFPAKRWGESIKDPGALATTQFYIKKKNTELLNLNQPMLTYNEPVGYYQSKDRILLDFLATNVMLSKKSYKVRYQLDGDERTLPSATPIYLTGLKPGKHSLTLELLDKNGNLAEGNFVRTQRDFIVLEDKK